MTALGVEIDALNLSSTRPDPFSTSEFYRNFLERHSGFARDDGAQLWFLVAFSGQTLVGYLALKLTTRRTLGQSTRTLDFLVAHHADRPHVVARADDLAAVSDAFYAYLHGRRDDWDFLEFQQQDPASSLFPPPATANLSGWSVREYPTWDNCTIHVRWRTIAQYFQALAKKFRSDLRRQLRRLLALGEVGLITCGDPAATPALFELYRSIEARSWKSGTDIAVGDDAARAKYLEGLLDPAQPMRIVIQILLLDGVPIAGLISGGFGKDLYALEITFDRRLAAASPGSAILLLGVRQAIDGGYETFNLLAGFGYYKSRWLATATPTRSAQIYRVGSLVHLRRLLGDVKRRFARVPVTAPLFNPLRRGQDESDTEGEGIAAQVTFDASEREAYEHTLARVRAADCEVLTAQQLSAVLPLETQSRAATRLVIDSTTSLSSPATLTSSTTVARCSPSFGS
jgi:CelD/BcsL family acetyltransferase involved in cellulose biosynthesis